MAHERAVLAGGCFWGMQDLMRKLPGIEATRVGYTGGDVPNATYHNHARRSNRDSVRSGQDFLSPHFGILFPDTRPTTMNRQGNDRGLSYRSAIFYVNEEQKQVALDTIADLNASGLWPGKVVTELEPVGNCWEAEPEHQDYLQRLPNGYTCHYPRPDWLLPQRARE